MLINIFPKGEPNCDTCKSKPPIIHPYNYFVYEIYEACCSYTIKDDLGPQDLEYLVVRQVLEDKGISPLELFELIEEVRKFALMIFKPIRKNAKEEIRQMRSKNGSNRN